MGCQVSPSSFCYTGTTGNLPGVSTLAPLVNWIQIVLEMSSDSTWSNVLHATGLSRRKLAGDHFFIHGDILFPASKQIETRRPVLATPGNVAMGNAWLPSPSSATQSQFVTTRPTLRGSWPTLLQYLLSTTATGAFDYTTTSTQKINGLGSFARLLAHMTSSTFAMSTNYLCQSSPMLATSSQCSGHFC